MPKGTRLLSEKARFVHLQLHPPPVPETDTKEKPLPEHVFVRFIVNQNSKSVTKALQYVKTVAKWTRSHVLNELEQEDVRLRGTIQFPELLTHTPLDELYELYGLVVTYAKTIQSPVSQQPVGKAWYVNHVAQLAHSCEPNCEILIGPNGGCEVYTLTSIEPNQPLTISYCRDIPHGIHSFVERREILAFLTLPTCMCTRCTREEKAEQQRVQTWSQQLGNTVSTWASVAKTDLFGTAFPMKQFLPNSQHIDYVQMHENHEFIVTELDNGEWVLDLVRHKLADPKIQEKWTAFREDAYAAGKSAYSLLCLAMGIPEKAYYEEKTKSITPKRKKVNKDGKSSSRREIPPPSWVAQWVYDDSRFQATLFHWQRFLKAVNRSPTCIHPTTAQQILTFVETHTPSSVPLNMWMSILSWSCLVNPTTGPATLEDVVTRLQTYSHVASKASLETYATQYVQAALAYEDMGIQEFRPVWEGWISPKVDES
jgi:hypothetical protein